MDIWSCAGVPVVTTSVGNQGIGLERVAEALVPDTPDGIAEHVVRLGRDPLLLEKLSRGGLEYMERRYGERQASDFRFAAMGIESSV